MFNFNIGDRLVREKGYLFSKHHALYAGLNKEDTEIVAENQFGIGVRYIPLSQFLDEGKLVRIEKFEGSLTEQNIILQKISQLIGTPYNLTNFNCEHFCNYVLFGKIESKQIKNATIILSLTTLAAIAYKYKKAQKPKRKLRRKV